MRRWAHEVLRSLFRELGLSKLFIKKKVSYLLRIYFINHITEISMLFYKNIDI